VKRCFHEIFCLSNIRENFHTVVIWCRNDRLTKCTLKSRGIFRHLLPSIFFIFAKIPQKEHIHCWISESEIPRFLQWGVKYLIEINFLLNDILVWRNFYSKDSSVHSIAHLHTVWKLRNFTATVISQIFRQINVLLKNFTLNWFDEKKLRGSEFLVFPHCVAQCGNCRNSLSHFFHKNFVKAMVLLKKLLKSWYDEIFFQWERISRFSTLCCGNSGILLPPFCCKNSVKSTFH